MDTINSEKLELIAEEDLLKITPPRLDRWLAKKINSNNEYPTLSRTRLKQLILDGYVMRNGQTIRDPSAIVKHLQKYSVVIPEAVQPTPIPEKMDLTIVYEDNNLLVIDKPADMVVHPAPGALTGTLVNALLAHCGNSLSGIGGVKRPGIVHRLDKDTSGLMVVARNEPAMQSLSEQISNRSIKRIYQAFTVGRIERSGKIEAPIGRHPKNRQKQAIIESGREAISHFKVIENFGSYSHLEVSLETGRTHQIRVHMNHLGFPLIGDPLYGRRRRFAKNTHQKLREIIESFPRQALHAAQLSFIDPTTSKEVSFQSKLPTDLAELRENLINQA